MQHDTLASATAGSERAAERLAWFYEQLTPADVTRLGSFYAEDARFKDPFNEVQGLPAIARVFEHMFSALVDPRFRVTDRVVQGERAFLVWEFDFRFRPGDRTVQCIRGVTQLRFDASGRVVLHRDYWDAAEELYEKIPALGAFMRWLRRRARS